MNAANRIRARFATFCEGPASCARHSEEPNSRARFRHEIAGFLIQKKMDELVSEIWQDISAAVSEADAALLSVRAGHPAGTSELFELSRSVHRAETFNYSMQVRLGLPASPPGNRSATLT